IPGHVLAVWIITFGLVELPESRIDIGVPGSSAYCGAEPERRKSELNRLFCGKAFEAQRIERPIGRTLWPPERGWASSKVLLGTEK
ncbi:hypothetical protein B0H19DRAFT_1151046, partial [Mycena capillaripes]